jgi:hypothetical protein
MNVFDLRDRLVGDYASYTRSFIKIADTRISRTVESSLNAGAFWPEPLLQLNPTFLPGGTIDQKPLRACCAFSLAKRMDCVFHPTLMRRELPSGGLFAEEFVELTPGPGGAPVAATALFAESCIRKAANERGFNSSLVSLADANAEDETASRWADCAFAYGHGNAAGVQCMFGRAGRCPE